MRSPLTSREWEVLDLLCGGLTVDGIADRLVLSRDTVRAHVKRILRKLGVHSQAEASSWPTASGDVRAGPGAAVERASETSPQVQVPPDIDRAERSGTTGRGGHQGPPDAARPGAT